MRNSSKVLITLALPLLFLAAGNHKFYLSLFQFKYVPAEKSLHCTAKVFTDDLELALKKNGMDVTLGKNLPDSVEQAIFRYMKKHTELQVDGKFLTWKWVGYEQENDVCFLYVEGVMDSLPKQAHLKVDFLHEIYEDQINLIHFEANGKKESHNLPKRSPSVQLSLE